MKIDGRTRLLGIVGDPVAHSLSPAIHNHALEALGMNLVYLPFKIPQEDIEDFVHLFPRFGGIGLNVTTPHKEAVARIVHAGDEEVACTGCCNTIAYNDSRAIGWSTDGLGFCRWIEEQRLLPRGRSIALLGFGATARSLVFRLGPLYRLIIVTRRPKEVERTLQSWQQKGWECASPHIRSWDSSPDPDLTLVVSSLPAAAGSTKIVTDWLAQQSRSVHLVDLNYGRERAVAAEAARRQGLTAFDGTGLLVHQAALSLSRWLDRRVEAELLHSGLDAQR